MRRRTAPLLALIPILSLVFLLLFSFSSSISKLATTRVPEAKNHLHVQKHIQVAHSTCEGTLYRDLCVSTLSSFPDLTSKSVPQMICSVINHTIDEVKYSSSNCSGLRSLRSLTKLEQRALDDCLYLFDDTISELKTTIAGLSQSKVGSNQHHYLQTLMSGAMTNVYTCLDGFAYCKGNLRSRIQDKLYDISHQVSNSLAMLKKVPGAVKKPSKSEAFPEYGKFKDGFPSWVSPKDRKLLQAAVNETKFDLVVAKDGTGNFKTIGEAVAAAPNSSTTRQVAIVNFE